MTDGKIPIRLRWLAAVCALMFAALGTRLWFMQVLASEEYRREARNNGTRLVEQPAPRGRIYDRNGRLLVGNRPNLTVMVDRQRLGKHEESVLFRLSSLLHMPVPRIAERLNDRRYYAYTPVPVKSVREPVAANILEHPAEFPGVQIDLLSARRYTHGNLAAHVLGNTGEINPDQLKSPAFSGYEPGDVVGQAGVEATYERWLQGTKGEKKYQVNSRGETIKTLGSTPPVPGDDLVLSIDSQIQYLAEHSLVLGEEAARSTFDPDTGRHYAADAGAVVVENPRNGQILAMASNPTFDPRVFLNGLSTKEYRDLKKPYRHNPLFNRAIQAQYPPGSTFKPFVALSALRRGLATQIGNYDCPGTYTVPGDRSGTEFDNWTTANTGYITLTRALQISCDTVFYDFGYRFWQRFAQSGPGPDNRELYKCKGRDNELQDDLRKFAFDRVTGVDLPFEADGRIPDCRWKRDVHHENPEAFPYSLWLPGDSINMSIGQGDTLVTPLQLAASYSAIANGGTLWQPHVALDVRRPDGRVVKRIKPHAIGRLPFSKSDLAFVRNALTYVPRPGGTAESAFVGFPLSEVPVAGKTGSAEVHPFQTYSWFAAMAPAYDPQYVVVCIVEQGGHGSTTAAPVVRKILEGLFDLPTTPNISLGQVAD